MTSNLNFHLIVPESSGITLLFGLLDKSVEPQI